VTQVVLGVVGAGTMGSGIAQLGCAADMRTVFHDPVPDALERGTQAVEAGLSKWSEKGRISTSAGERLEVASALDRLADCDLVIEAAPERSELKRALFAELSEICGRRAVLPPIPPRFPSPHSPAPRGGRRTSSACTSSTRRR
jgi:3-hydroxybutyryl-CoA dehydrogenase